MRNLKIFLVEDDEIYSAILAQKLKVFGNFMVYTYGTGEDGLVDLTEIDPDVIILDYDLPGISGLDTLKKINSIKNSDGIKAKVLFLSGIEKQPIIDDCMANGAYQFIVKDADVAVKVYSAVCQIMEEEDKPKGFLGGLFGRRKKRK